MFELPRNMNLKKFILPVLTAFAWFSNNTYAVTAPVLQFTEKSATDLTVTLDGESLGTVKNLGQNQWEWHSGMSGETLAEFLGFIPLQWVEPENDSVNLVTFGLFVPDFTADQLKTAQVDSELGALISSDTASVPGVPSSGNGQPAGPLTLPGLFATVVFVDLGDEESGVPDSGSTSVLLLGASLALIGLSRFRCAAVA
jgi:hypothetical protein